MGEFICSLRTRVGGGADRLNILPRVSHECWDVAIRKAGSVRAYRGRGQLTLLITPQAHDPIYACHEMAKTSALPPGAKYSTSVVLTFACSSCSCSAPGGVMYV